MATAPNHSGNLPREFEICPACGKKGLYRYGGTILRGKHGYGGCPPGRRCKYCRHRIEDATEEEYAALLTLSLGRKTEPARESARVIEDGSFVAERNPNGSINRLIVGGAIEIDRPQLLQLARVLAYDPTLCRPPERKFARFG